jgi:hypothetical protein
MANSQNLTQAGKGRPKGATNKATREIREAAKAFGPEALNAIAKIMIEGEAEANRLAAAKELLDRGFGKSTQMVATDEEAGGFSVQVVTGVPRD